MDLNSVINKMAAEYNQQQQQAKLQALAQMGFNDPSGGGVVNPTMKQTPNLGANMLGLLAQGAMGVTRGMTMGALNPYEGKAFGQQVMPGVANSLKTLGVSPGVADENVGGMVGELAGGLGTGIGLSNLLKNSSRVGALGKILGETAIGGAFGVQGDGTDVGIGAGLGLGAGMLQYGKAPILQGLEALGQRGSFSTNPSGGSSLVDSVSAKASEIGRKIVHTNLLKDGMVSKNLGGKNLYEWFTAPMDRMPVAVGRKFNETMIEGAKMQKAWEKVAMQLPELNLAERESVKQVMKDGFKFDNIDPEHEAKVYEIFKPYREMLGETAPRLFSRPAHGRMYQRNMNKRLGEMFKNTGAQDDAFTIFKNLDIYDLTTPKGTRAFLEDMIKNDHLSPEAKQHALDLYDLPSKTAGEVATSSKKALEYVLYNQVKKTNMAMTGYEFGARRIPSITNADGTYDWTKLAKNELRNTDVFKPEDWVDMHAGKYPMFKGMKVHKDVAEAIRDIDEVMPTMQKLWNKYYLNPFKFAKVVLNPPARIRDLVSNMIFNDIGGAHPLSPMRLDVYTKALKKMKAGDPEFKEFTRIMGVDATSWSNNEIAPYLDAIRHGHGMLEVPYRLLYDNKLSKFMADTTTKSDTWMKFSKYMWNLEKGMASDDAAFDAARTVGDHMRNTRFTRLVRDTAMPFFGWQVHAIKTMGAGIAKHPIRTSKYLLGPYAMQQAAVENLGLSEDEFQEIRNTLPGYMQKHAFGIPSFVPMPYRDEKGRIQFVDLSWWIPGVQDVAEMGAPLGTGEPKDLVRFFQNPAFNVLSSLAQNKKFSGVPIYEEWETPDVKAAKFFGFIAQQHMPALTPEVGTSWEKIAKSFNEEDPTALTPTQALGTQFGYKVTPIDETTQAGYKETQQKKWLAAAKSSMEKQISRTSDEKKIAKIYEHYQNVVDRILEEK